MAGSNRRPSRYKHDALPSKLMELCNVTNIILITLLIAGGGIRTHEAFAVDLKSTPFDRSGTPARCYFIYYIITLFLSILYLFILKYFIII